MNLFAEAIAWIFSPDRLADNVPLPTLIVQHVYFTFLSVLIAAVIAIPLGYLIGHTGRGREFAVGLSGAARAVPSFGLILLLVLVIGVTQKPLAASVAFVLLAIPSILAGAYSGLEQIDRRVVDAARAMGMTEWQILWKVEVPLGLPLLIGGLRAATLQVVATVTLAAYIGLGGLGLPIISGLALRRFDQMLGAALVIVVLALALDGLFAILQHAVVPRGVASGRSSDVRSAPTRRGAVVGTPIEEGKG
ncbi:osmoprotectant transport system permease protein [Microbacteriaceae bacterium SG_E_30_P1]|uniref:Osmoprotectant transport system permease protein n=1 Tax=Antiquaquibacter oligotrophicus TaxID=2880260 RepID=A0ABT6KMD0_9MICO|nr:ABC transporter permease [Antiquaquibacter oligotrophicus]MDH6181171.1 osmoprotectant transport system permease protein [Antiquaquibacter oligotrophicus]UDF13134.1 ABC transporter permease [Antiquaquibacter oligotrophicus]